MISKNNILFVLTTAKNPQSNTMVERLHQTLNTTIAINLRENPSQSFQEVSSLIHQKCAAAQYAICATSNSQHEVSSGKLDYGRQLMYPFAKVSRLGKTPRS